MKRLALLGLAAVALAGCGGGSSGPDFPTIGAARTYEIAHFRPVRPIEPREPTSISFFIRQPDGQPLTKFKRGAGPHTGVHLIFVHSDLASIIHKHPPVAPDGTIRETLTFPDPGRYRMVVDVYPATGPQPNFQLFRNVRVAGVAPPRPLPAPEQVVVSDGYRFAMQPHRPLKAIEAQLLNIDVTDAQGRPVTFEPYYGALAHAIFFRKGTLDYFHTHVCAPGAAGCTSFLGGAKVTGSSTKPGRLTVGVLVPAPGTWRLFLQTKIDGRVVTAPFTLIVK